MRLQDNLEEAGFRQRLRQWLAANKVSIAAHDWEALRQWQKTLYKAGWIGLSWPKQYGGQGASLREQLIYNEEMARADVPQPLNSIGLMIVGPAIIACGSEEHKKRYLPRILSGEEIWCQGFSEPNAGSDLASLQTRAVFEGDHYLVTGQKIWTSHSRIADYCFLLVRTDPDAPRHKGLSCLAVEMQSPGVTVKPLRQITGDAEFGEVFFDQVRVPKQNLIGAENDGWMVAMKTFTRERANIAMALSVGLQRSFAKLLNSVPGRGSKPHADLRQRVAQSYVDSELLRLSCARFGEQLYGFHSSLIKVSWAETNQRLEELGLNTLGPEAALMPEGDPEQSWQFGYMRSRGNSIEGGTSEILRGIIAERILGLPRN